MATKKYKLKTNFEDFRVEERQQLDLVDDGQYSIFKIEKRGLDTIGALRMSAKHLKVALNNIGYSGLKDRYSLSSQYISVPSKELGREIPVGHVEKMGKYMTLKYIGQTIGPLQLGDHTSNFFRLTLRRLNPESLEMLKNNISSLLENPWVPNYFDSQKFGYLGGPEGLFAGWYLKGDHEKALKLVMATPNRKERPRSKVVHKYLQEHWGDWSACTEFLAENRFENYIDITTYLEKKPDDFLGAIKVISPDKLKLKITSLQAYLWNEYLKMILFEVFPDQEFVDVKYHVGLQKFPKDPAGLRSADKSILAVIPEAAEKDGPPAIPLPAPELVEPYRSRYGHLLERDFHIGDLSEFEKFSELNYKTSEYRRPLFFKPKDLELVAEGQDEEISRKKNWYCTLTFELPPGSYATVLIKALMLA